MAKKINTKQTTASRGDSLFVRTKRFLTDDHTHFIIGLIFMIFAIYMGFALLSFFFTGGADQSRIENVSLTDLVINRGSVENWAGVRGAYLSNLLLNRWFGISSFLILYFLASVGAYLMRLIKISILKRFLFSASMLIWGSLFFAFVFIRGYEDTFIYLGGQHGYYLSIQMMNNIGVPGTFLLLLGSLLIIAILSSKKTIPVLRYLFSFVWLKSLFARRSQSADSGDDVEETEEGDEQQQTPTDGDLESQADDGEKISIQKLVNETIQEKENGPEQQSEGGVTEEESFVEVDERDSMENQSKFGGVENDPMEVEVPGEEEQVDTQQTKYDPRLDLSRYQFPAFDLLRQYDNGSVEVNQEELEENKQLIKRTLEEFQIRIATIKATIGPTVTLYEIVPEAGVRIAKIKSLEDDIALKLSALQIRIIAPIPGKGTVGIEVPNKNPQTVSMRTIVSSLRFQECKYDLPVAMGKTIVNEVFMFDLCKTPHLLVAGATGQGKSVGLNAIITSLLYRKHPAELKFVMIDPKRVEFSIYSKIERHYLAKLPNIDKPIVTEPEDAVATLNSLVIEMEQRYELLVEANTRNIKEYNEKFIDHRLNPEKGHHYLPYIVAIVDEFADLIAISGRDIEFPISRIAAKARAVGIHMILATQRPDTKVITGTIKSNFPSRIAFKVMSMIDSRTILDQPGANRLIGKGDMLVLITGSEPTRVQCAFVDTPEVENIVDHVCKQVAYPTAYILPEYVEEGREGDGGSSTSVDLSVRDPLFEEVARFVVIQQQASTSLIQRKFSIGYNRAGRLMDQLEAAGIVGPYEGSKPRQVLISDEYTLEQLLNDLKKRDKRQ